MKFGLAAPTCGTFASRDAVRRFAQKAEELGLDTIWVPDHVSYGRDWLGHRSSGLTEQIMAETEPRFYESTSTLSYMAGFTERIRLGTGILVLPLRNPLILGRQLITIQDLSDGRLILGTGIGDYPPDFQAMGVTYEARAAIFEDYLEALRKILGGGSVSHHGQFVHFDDAQFYPRVDPPPILVGGGVIAVPEPNDDRLAMRVLRRVARLGDGWMPDWGRPDVIERGVRTIRQLAQSYGRENPNLQITFSTKLYLADTDEEAQRKTHLSLEFAHQEANIVAKFGTRTPTKALTMSLIGSSKSLVKQIEEYGRAGVTCFKMAAMTSDLESLFCMMERFAKEIVPCF